MLELGGVPIDFLPNEHNYHRDLFQMGQVRRDVNYRLVISNPAIGYRWRLVFYYGPVLEPVITSLYTGATTTFSDLDGQTYDVAVLSFGFDGYFAPFLSEMSLTIETINPVV